jgi:hypothetical protein
MAAQANTTRRAILKAFPMFGVAAVASTSPLIAAALPPSPQERIVAAMAEIQDALQELHPGWAIQAPLDTVQHVTRIENGSTSKGDPYSHAILFYAYDGEHGSQTGSWMRTYR